MTLNPYYVIYIILMSQEVRYFAHRNNLFSLAREDKA